MTLENQANQPIGNKMKEQILQFLHQEDGLTMVEYALAGALIAAALVAAFVVFGDQVADLINVIAGEIS